MNPDTQTQLRSTLWLSLCVLLVFGILGCVAVRKTKLAPMPIVQPAPRAVTNQAQAVAPPRLVTPPRTNVTYLIECPSWPVQVFQIICKPKLNGGQWRHYTNVVQQNWFTVPCTTADQCYFTIGATWLVSNTNDVLRWEGW